MINEKINKIILEDYAIKAGVNYLMPTLWWE